MNSCPSAHSVSAVESIPVSLFTVAACLAVGSGCLALLAMLGLLGVCPPLGGAGLSPHCIKHYDNRVEWFSSHRRAGTPCLFLGIQLALVPAAAVGTGENRDG